MKLKIVYIFVFVSFKFDDVDASGGSGASPCEDQLDSCARAAAHCQNDRLKVTLARNCKKTCGYCTGKKKVPKKDEWNNWNGGSEEDPSTPVPYSPPSNGGGVPYNPPSNPVPYNPYDPPQNPNPVPYNRYDPVPDNPYDPVPRNPNPVPYNPNPYYQSPYYQNPYNNDGYPLSDPYNPYESYNNNPYNNGYPNPYFSNIPCVDKSNACSYWVSSFLKSLF
ncbi:hypothetical protein M3Y97_01035300 [Aphelenchoides bicaudatus]|nr:hypothetical protein M3Y97_01035300 [Aphelenchoides bicaudatus]